MSELLGSGLVGKPYLMIWITMLRFFLLTTILGSLSALPASAQQVERQSVLITATQLLEAKEAADRLIAAGDCIAALPALERLVERADIHASLIYAGARAMMEGPDAKAIPDALYDEMLPAIEDYGRALNVRNEGWVAIAECRVQADQADAAVGAYLKALELVNAKTERPTWDRARQGLWKLIGVMQ